jgi:plastocyanin
MPRARASILLAAAVVIALAAGGGAEAATYYGKVGPKKTITLKNKAGSNVTSIPAGKHTFVVKDASTIHDFRLSLGGTDLRKTTLEFVGTKTWTLTLKKGRTYRYYCSVHTSEMSKTFRVR